VHNLVVVQSDAERGLIMLRGAVPGAKGGYVLIRDAVKRPAAEGVPFPAAVREPSGRGEAGQDAATPADANAQAPAEEE
jgi:large subunit ribosomal protein L3